MRPIMITNIASPGSSCATTAEPTGTFRTVTREVRSSIAVIGSAANSGARAIVARIRARSSPTMRGSGVVDGRTGSGAGAAGRAIPSDIGCSSWTQKTHEQPVFARVMPASGIPARSTWFRTVDCDPTPGSVTKPSHVRTRPRHRCRGHHTWPSASLTSDLGAAAPPVRGSFPADVRQHRGGHQR